MHQIGETDRQATTIHRQTYAASKGAVAMFTKGLWTDLAKHGLQINGIAPGYFVTELTKPLVDNEEFSGWLCKRTPAGRWGNVKELTVNRHPIFSTDRRPKVST